MMVWMDLTAQAAAMPAHHLRSVFRILYILVWIRMRIRILGTAPLAYGSGCVYGCGSVPKSSVTIRMQKIKFCQIFNVLIIEILSFKIVNIC
jgi:hypothetical protein